MCCPALPLSQLFETAAELTVMDMLHRLGPRRLGSLRLLYRAPSRVSLTRWRRLTVLDVVAAAESRSDGRRRRPSRAGYDAAGHCGHGADDGQRWDGDRRAGDHRQSRYAAGDGKHPADHHRNART